MTDVAVVDYGMGNLDSVVRAIEECGASATVTSEPDDLTTAAAIVLPGVGSFADGIRGLDARGLGQQVRKEVLDHEIPLLGICLGMQLLADQGEEGGGASGLGLVPGVVRRLEPEDPSVRIPHVGWNEVHPERSSPLLDGVDNGADFYFVHSYHLEPTDSQDILARTPYCGGFVSAVARGNILGVQFHPEKSQGMGLKLIANFLEGC